jgi:hypothetical protein
MRANARTFCLIGMLVFPLMSLSAQQTRTARDGAWRIVRQEVHEPGSQPRSVAPWGGLVVIAGRYYSQFLYDTTNTGVTQAAQLTTIEQKAARYDGIRAANSGEFELQGSKMTAHVQHALNPSRVGNTLTARTLQHSDTLTVTTTQPWPKDTTKSVQTIFTYIRLH